MKPYTPTTTIINNARNKLNEYFFAPQQTAAFAFFRIAIALHCIIHLVTMLPYYDLILGKEGFSYREVTEALINLQFIPRISIVCNWLLKLGINDHDAIRYVVFAYIGVLVSMLVGFKTRATVFLAILFHLAFLKTNELFAYGMDYFISISLFYCLFMPVSDFSLDHYLAKKPDFQHPYNRFYSRMLQWHLCLAYLLGGLHKAVGLHWWTGESIWRAVMRPPFKQFDMSFLAHMPNTTMLLGWSVVLTELLYPFCMPAPKLRRYWLPAVIFLHLGIGIFMRLHFFASVMIILNIAAFGWLDMEKWFAGMSKKYRINRFAAAL